MRRGSLIHLLLEHLPNRPQPEWGTLAEALIQRYDNRSNPTEIKELLNNAALVLNTAALKPVFDKTALAEVAIITGKIPALADICLYGTIDRLIVSDSTVLAVDFKSNRRVPETVNDVPLGLLRQMGAYLLALRPIYPDHKIEVAILWTESQQLMRLPHDIVIDSLKDATIS